MRNHSNENEFGLYENEPVVGIHFHMNGFALRLVLTRRQKGTRKWPIGSTMFLSSDSLSWFVASILTLLDWLRNSAIQLKQCFRQQLH